MNKVITGGIFAGIGLFAITLCAPTAQAAYHQPPEVKVFDSTTALQERSFFPYALGWSGGVRIATGDIDGDGSKEIITAPGPGGGPNVQVFTRSGKRIVQFMAYDETFRGGVFVTAGDVDGDGKDEIITSPDSGGGPHVRVFDEQGQVQSQFFAFDATMRGGVTIASGDTNGDGTDEIIAANGIGYRSEVKIFSGAGTYLHQTYYPFTDTDHGGVSLATGNFDGDAADEIVMGIRRYGRAWIKIYNNDADRTIVSEFNGFPETFRGGVSVAAGDLNADGVDEVIVGAQAGAGPHVRTFTNTGHPRSYNFFPYPLEWHGGVTVAAFDRDGDGRDDVVTAPSAFRTGGRPDLAQYIEVDLSEQRLTAYAYGKVVNTFLISSGKAGFDTPTGDFSITEKIYSKHYSGYYGPGSPNNYDLPNTLWNLRYDGPRLLHGAYWHNNFGHVMSHGCVNISYPNAQWLYNWAQIGTAVSVVD